MTARHVVAGAWLLAVRVPGHERAYFARLIYSNEEPDIAFLSIVGKQQQTS